jgi:hypothetical protein
MASPRWFEQLQAQLVRSDLPDDYVERLLEELSDHFQDLMEETMSTQAEVCARLGEPQDVADAAAFGYRHRGYLGRHPAIAGLVFAVSPIVALAALSYTVLLSMVVGAEWLGIVGDGASPLGTTSQAILSYGLKLATIVLPSLVLAVAYCRLAGRCGIGRKWMITSCVVLAVLAALAGIQLTFAETPGHGSVSLSLGVGLTETVQMLQLLVPLAVAWWFARRRGERDVVSTTS